MIFRGGGSGLTGGVVPQREETLLISLERMNRFAICPGEERAEVEGGVNTFRFRKEVEQAGLYFPPYPSSEKISTIGGNLAENAGGIRSYKYGPIGKFVTGLEVVVKEGKRILLGGKVFRDVAGYNLTSLFVGSEGTLGCITKGYLRLLPFPPFRIGFFAFLENLDLLKEIPPLFFSVGVFPAVLEFFDGEIMSTFPGSLPTPPFPCAGFLYGELEGIEEGVRKEIVQVEASFSRWGVPILWWGEEERNSFLSFREELGLKIERLFGGRINEDLVFPRKELPFAVGKIKALGKEHNLPVFVFGHMGDGNLHVQILFHPEKEEERNRALSLISSLFSLTLSLQGSITGEHGIGITKRKYLKAQVGEEVYSLLKEIKSLLDPLGLFNPGKVVV